MSGLVKFISQRSLSSFSFAKRGSFFQEPPKITNQYDEDSFMKEQLQIEIPKEHLKEIEGDLRQFGERVATDIHKLHIECENNKPRHEPFDAWGNRVDRLVTCDAWRQMKRISAEEGLIAIPYEKKFSVYSRIYQIYKLYLFAPSAGLFGCPLAMTDGAAKTIQTVGIQEFTKEAFENLTTRDPNKFWTSGQWMTERKGGSDVSTATETQAFLQSNLHYKLYGFKWFSSAADSDMTITLARVMDKNNKPDKYLSMFFARVRNDDGRLNGIELQGLKNKLGTRQLPTGELLLDGMDAFRMSEVGRGVPQITSMLNITRIHTALTALGFMRRITNLARDYATRRHAFGKLIIDHDLHCQTLGNMEVECRASFLMLTFVAKLLGKYECNQASDDEKELFRFLTPLLKLYTGKQTVAVNSEGLEAFGGQGYIEDTGLPTYLRDAQVLPIWEGTTNILSLDVLRSIEKSKGMSIRVFAKHVNSICEEAKKVDLLKDKANAVSLALGQLLKAVKPDNNELVTGAREFSFSLYRIFTASLIMERCMKTNLKDTDLFLLEKWMMQDIVPFITSQRLNLFNSKTTSVNKKLFMSGHPSWN